MRRLLPSVLGLQALKNPVRVGPRQVVSAKWIDISIAASATAEVQLNTSLSVASTPAATNLGADIILAADQAIVIETIDAYINEADSAGKLVVQSCNVKDSINRWMPISTQGSPLPKTFALTSNDYFILVLDQPNRYQLMRDEADFAGGTHNYFVQMWAVIENTDSGAAHAYVASVAMQYRIVSGLDPVDVTLFHFGDED